MFRIHLLNTIHTPEDWVGCDFVICGIFALCCVELNIVCSVFVLSFGVFGVSFSVPGLPFDFLGDHLFAPLVPLSL